MNALLSRVVHTEAAPSASVRKLPLGPDMKWFSEAAGFIARGGNYLLSGGPGSGKSTLAAQLALSAASLGERVLFILTEQPAAQVQERFHQLLISLAGEAWSREIIQRVVLEDNLYDLRGLPEYLLREVLSPNGRRAGTTLMVIDSLHGLGDSPSDKTFYKSVYETMRLTRGAGVACVLIAHETKDRRVAGPRALEHAADVTIIMRRGIACRALAIPKNRFGPARPNPLALSVAQTIGTLEPSPFEQASSATVASFAGSERVEVQVALSLARAGRRGVLKTPGLPKREIESVFDALGQIDGVCFEPDGFDAQVRIPSGVAYRREFNLSILLAAAAAATRSKINPSWIALGDVDLHRRVRLAPPELLTKLSELLQTGELPDVSAVLCGAGAGAAVSWPAAENILREFETADQAVQKLLC